ncbi:hypothetical protein MSAN_01803800 [Mycena sanguinolenta]|uniref:Uncharacterized protein n=1 Tax=Mycena sanguinolenta TaxID=230812 RepID=A0A8H7CSJ2_9AGAR|nr:hypothetical protein MSAN_01803800 [Mycena sanguinolenta]
MYPALPPRVRMPPSAVGADWGREMTRSTAEMKVALDGETKACTCKWTTCFRGRSRIRGQCVFASNERECKGKHESTAVPLVPSSMSPPSMSPPRTSPSSCSITLPQAPTSLPNSLYIAATSSHPSFHRVGASTSTRSRWGGVVAVKRHLASAAATKTMESVGETAGPTGAKGESTHCLCAPPFPRARRGRGRSKGLEVQPGLRVGAPRAGRRSDASSLSPRASETNTTPVLSMVVLSLSHPYWSSSSAYTPWSICSSKISLQRPTAPASNFSICRPSSSCGVVSSTKYWTVAFLILTCVLTLLCQFCSLFTRLDQNSTSDFLLNCFANVNASLTLADP